MAPRIWNLSLVKLLVAFCSAATGSPFYPNVSSTTTVQVVATTTVLQAITATITAAPANSPVETIPGYWSLHCPLIDGPCTVWCRPDDHGCRYSASSVVETCSLSWANWRSAHDYYHAQPQGSSGVQWTSWDTTLPVTTETITWTTEWYTSFTSSNETVTRMNIGDETEATAFVPVWGLGSKAHSIYYVSVTHSATRVRGWTAPLPTCLYEEVIVTAPPNITSTASALPTPGDSAAAECGKCTINGGTVQLLFWPSSSMPQDGSSNTSRYSVLSGTTLVSPTAYISLATPFASNDCGRVGRNHTATLLPMRPEDVSTQINIGAWGLQEAMRFWQVNFDDLAGLPPVSNFQMQPSCIRYGCPTMDPKFNPTLSVPAILRSVDPLWADCGLPIGGLYDPPKALTIASVAAYATQPSGGSTTTTLASPPSSYGAASVIRTSLETQLASILDDLQPSSSESHSYFSRTSSTSQLSGIIKSASTNQITLSEIVVSSDHSTTSPIDASPASKGAPGPTIDHPTRISSSSSVVSYVGDDRTFSSDAENSQLDATSLFKGRTTGILQPTGAYRETYHRSVPSISEDASGNLLVDGQTFATNSPVTLQVGDESETAYMVVTSYRTYIVLGNTCTVPFGQPAVANTTFVPTNCSSTSQLSPRTSSGLGTYLPGVTTAAQVAPAHSEAARRMLEPSASMALCLFTIGIAALAAWL